METMIYTRYHLFQNADVYFLILLNLKALLLVLVNLREE